MDGKEQIVLVLIAGTAVVLFLASLLILYIIVFQKRQNTFIREKESIKTAYEQELLRTKLEIQEQTLKNVGEEIHDNIGQTLSLAKLNLNTRKENEPVHAEEKVITAKDLISKAILDLRRLSKTLNADAMLSAGLIKAIEYELQLIGKTGVFKTELKIAGEPVLVDRHKEIILFRIVQEALNNIIKHAEASVITIYLDFGERLLLSVTDNGRGITSARVEETDHGSGLNNMRSRAQLIGGTLQIESSSVNGTTVSIILPINQP